MSNKRNSEIPILGAYQKHLQHYKNMRNLLKARQTQVDLMSLRRKTIQDSNVINYQREYDRIRGLLSKQNVGLGQNTIERMRQREGELAMLGAKAVDNIQ